MDGILSHYLRYLKRAAQFSLTNDHNTKEGVVVASDSDWEVLYSTTGETRSRSGSIITLDGMLIVWASQHQKFVGMSYKGGLKEAEVA